LDLVRPQHGAGAGGLVLGEGLDAGGVLAVVQLVLLDLGGQALAVDLGAADLGVLVLVDEVVAADAGQHDDDGDDDEHFEEREGGAGGPPGGGGGGTEQHGYGTSIRGQSTQRNLPGGRLKVREDVCGAGRGWPSQWTLPGAGVAPDASGARRGRAGRAARRV